ncbi:MAG: hypothetical protein HXN95_08265 [Prevotella salivae]|jgi:hypothetical protein|uniref:hypothetical protein n=1 Tax=Segatella salivae TaxID=228604 RepID=UPI001CAD1946|nr:hypothetical protein [Segatella salivae]MBF1521998.1 hypothetical protein [Segatella salivae]
MSSSPVSSVLFLSPFNSFSLQPPNPLLLNPIPPLSFLPYFSGRGGAKAGGGSSQWLTTWTAVEEENDSVGQATDKLWGEKGGGGCHAMVLKRGDENMQNGVENEVKNDEKYKQMWRKMKQKTKRNK